MTAATVESKEYGFEIRPKNVDDNSLPPWILTKY